MASPKEPCIRRGPRRTSSPKKGYDDRCSITAANAAAGAVDNRGQNMCRVGWALLGLTFTRAMLR